MNMNKQIERVRELAQVLKRRRRSRRGMNLVEVVIVIAIILIIIGVLGFAASQVYNNSKVSSTQMEMNGLGTAVTSHMFQVNKGQPPASLKDLSDLTELQLEDAWGNEYEYVVPGPGNNEFDIISYGEDGQEGGTGRAADIRYSDK
jgi:general secretion pathway protein G